MYYFLKRQADADPCAYRILLRKGIFASTDAYKEIKGIFSDKSINFARQRGEESFREDLVNLLSSLKSPKVFFLVDDIVFVEDLEMDDFTRFDTDKYIPSLRLGRNISLFYHFSVNQPHPQFITKNQDDKTKLFWRWEQGVYDWGYPLSLDGHLFSTDELLSIMQLIHFKAPNSLEASLQKFAKLFGQRLGVCYQKSKIINIPCNKVQRENKNIFGSVDQHFLLRKWQEGFQMDYRKLYGFVNQSPQQEIEFQLIPRST
jgi:hypothetical protein